MRNRSGFTNNIERANKYDEDQLVKVVRFHEAAIGIKFDIIQITTKISISDFPRPAELDEAIEENSDSDEDRGRDSRRERGSRGPKTFDPSEGRESGPESPEDNSGNDEVSSPDESINSGPSLPGDEPSIS